MACHFTGFDSSWGVGFFGFWVERVVISVLLAGLCVVVCFGSCLLFFLCFFVFSLLCFCVGQARFGHIKIVSVTTFFLIKNILSHGREKTAYGNKS